MITEEEASFETHDYMNFLAIQLKNSTATGELEMTLTGSRAHLPLPVPLQTHVTDEPLCPCQGRTAPKWTTKW